MHEYGHYIQSQRSGIFFLSKYALPSLLTQTDLGFDGRHDDFWVERDASQRAFDYFTDARRGLMPIIGIIEIFQGERFVT